MQFGVDLITFYNPVYWGVECAAEIINVATADPSAFWRRIFAAIQAGGAREVELTFAPFDWRSLLQAFRSITNIRKELETYGLTIISSYCVDLERVDPYGGQDLPTDLIREIGEAANFLAQLSGGAIVASLPMRRTYGVTPSGFVDMATALPIADFLNRIGMATAAEGIDFALHTEAHTMFCAPRDIDLFLLLTDPRYVYFCPDSAHIFLEGGDPATIVSRYRERVRLSHWKDATAPMPRDTPIDKKIHERHRDYFSELGQGKIDFQALAVATAQLPHPRPIILELDASPAPVPTITDGCRFAAHVLQDAP
ncbi:sugar phosphate isomerase/epimerase family protein [Acetobacter sp.]|jgi:inosose dehydratase|uniref:sugar phosphate isomerase/epimerase family protein n=1 Tax=Acetobacter sp. TaxID=440 RepID=UPI0025C3202B|nr:sugar phosphate isomerase/epimerase [Acetobacter sp.]MCH4090768.1 sugar phosphate isomerase/epimerase [Acetobacter sp.]MCI1300516.1 sugar phosphate isomerase/epimerase [Acetobacter sp.]MCI1316282.1 sugar phosphate isomerase/epimerase [Acetobacter sp.]